MKVGLILLIEKKDHKIITARKIKEMWSVLSTTKWATNPISVMQRRENK